MVQVRTLGEREVGQLLKPGKVPVCSQGTLPLSQSRLSTSEERNPSILLKPWDNFVYQRVGRHRCHGQERRYSKDTCAPPSGCLVAETMDSKILEFPQESHAGEGKGWESGV